MSLLKNTVCYLCGNAATTFDHVPPKSFFPNEENVKGYKLPACATCNNSFSKDEEYVRDCFSINGQNEEARQVFTEKTRQSYLRPYTTLQLVPKFQRIKRDLIPLDIKSKNGVYLGSATGLKMKPIRVERVIEKIIRGLVFYHLNERMPTDYSIRVYFQPKEILPELLEKKTGIIGRFGNIFAYKALLSKDDKFVGFWWISFYRSIGAICVMQSPEIAEIV